MVQKRSYRSQRVNCKLTSDGYTMQGVLQLRLTDGGSKNTQTTNILTTNQTPKSVTINKQRTSIWNNTGTSSVSSFLTTASGIAPYKKSGLLSEMKLCSNVVGIFARIILLFLTRLQVPGLVPLDSCRKSALFWCIYVSGAPTRYPSLPRDNSFLMCKNKGILTATKSLQTLSSNRNDKDAQRYLGPGTPYISPRWFFWICCVPKPIFVARH